MGCVSLLLKRSNLSPAWVRYQMRELDPARTPPILRDRRLMSPNSYNFLRLRLVALSPAEELAASVNTSRCICPVIKYRYCCTTPSSSRSRSPRRLSISSNRLLDTRCDVWLSVSGVPPTAGGSEAGTLKESRTLNRAKPFIPAFSACGLSPPFVSRSVMVFSSSRC